MLRFVGQFARARSSFFQACASSSSTTEQPSEKKSAFRVEIRDKLAYLYFDSPDSSVNTLHPDNTPLFDDLIAGLDKNPDVDAIIILSAKTDSFIAGADIDALEGKSEDELYHISRGGQQSFVKMRNLSKPTVAAIHGPCLGGGLEFAINCTYRVATNHPKTVLGLPEVKLGLLPGATGTSRLVELLGLPTALGMMLNGSNVRPEQARKNRLVDQLCDKNALVDTATQAARDLAKKKVVPARSLNLTNWLPTRFFALRNYALNQARKMVMEKTGGMYPAPLRILDVVKTALERGQEAGLEAEAKGFASLGVSPQSAGLISLFKGTRAISKSRFGEPPIPVKKQKVAVLGAGLMGAGIAQVSIQKAQCETVLNDVDDERISRGLKQIYGNLNERVKRRIDTEFARDTVMSRLTPVPSSSASWAQHFKDVTLVIEAVPESLALKHKVLQRVEEVVPEHCIIASNTSALPIGDIAAGLKNPARVVGMHYFSPVDKMELLEIITTDKTSREATATAVAVGKAQGKHCIVIKDKAGFYTTRILAAFMPEVTPLLAEGITPLEIDRALQAWGFPVGPITLMDEVGIDVGMHIGRDLSKHFGERVGPSSSLHLLESMVNNGFLGRKSAKGFFLYPEEGIKDQKDKSKKKKKSSGGKKEKVLNPGIQPILQELQAGSKFTPRTQQEIQERMALRMVNEAVYCLQEEVLANPIEGDIGAVFGLGFPPFFGGPFRYIDLQGASQVLDKLNRLQDTYGPRFQPAEMLKEYAKSNKKFHS